MSAVKIVLSTQNTKILNSAWNVETTITQKFEFTLFPENELKINSRNTSVNATVDLLAN